MASVFNSPVVYGLTSEQKSILNDFIRENIKENIPIYRLCDLLKMGQSSVIKKIKLSYGLTPQKLIENVRIGTAKYYIATSGLSLAQIAYRTGFTHQSRFGEVFKRYVGCSPGFYRCQHACDN